MNSDQARRVLGIDHDADLDAASLKKAYRKSVLRAHPDTGGSDDDFKAVSDAYEVLSRDVERAQNRNSGDDVFVRAGDWRQASGTMWSDGDMHWRWNGTRVHPGPRPRRVYSIDHVIPLLEAVPGSVREFPLLMPDGNEHAISFVIPDNIANEMRVSIEVGDDWTVLATLYVWPPEGYAVAGQNLVYEHSITGIEACIGGRFRLRHPTGATWDVAVPPGIADGKTVRMHGHGVGGRGDLLIVFRIAAADLSAWKSGIEAVLASPPGAPVDNADKNDDTVEHDDDTNHDDDDAGGDEA